MDRDRVSPLGIPTLEKIDKAFFGPVKVKVYHDVVVTSARCLKCNATVEGRTKIPEHLRDKFSDPKNHGELVQHAADKVYREHQCVLLDDGKDTPEEFFRKLRSA